MSLNRTGSVTICNNTIHEGVIEIKDVRETRQRATVNVREPWFLSLIYVHADFSHYTLCPLPRAQIVLRPGLIDWLNKGLRRKLILIYPQGL